MPVCRYLIIQGCMVFVFFAMVIDTVSRARSMFWQNGHDHFTTFDFVMLFYDSLVVTAMPIYIGFRVFFAVDSKRAVAGTDVKYLYVRHALLTMHGIEFTRTACSTPCN